MNTENLSGVRYAQFVYLDKFLDHQFRDGALTVTVVLKGIFFLREDCFR